MALQLLTGGLVTGLPTLTPPPVTGTKSHCDLVPVQHVNPFSAGVPGLPHNMIAAMPQLNFPQFDGSNPHMWKSRCETFFELYHIPQEFWPKLATMHFVGSAAFWFQSMYELKDNLTWPNLCAAVCDRFQRD